MVMMRLLIILLSQMISSSTLGGMDPFFVSMNLCRRVILVLILGSDLGVHMFERQPVCRQATVSYVQLILAGQSTKFIFFWSQWHMVRDHSQVCQFVDAVWMTNRFIFLRHRVHGHCYPWLAGYPWTIYRCCKQGKYQQCDRDEQCTHFYYGD